MADPENRRPLTDKQVIDTTRKWIEEDIVGKGLCPPMVKLLQKHRDEGGKVNWDELKDQVEIKSYASFAPEGSPLLQTVSKDHMNFIVNATRGEAPLTRVSVLPDFPSNPAYDKFMKDLKINTFKDLLTTYRGKETCASAFRQATELDGVDSTIVEDTIKSTDQRVKAEMAEMVVEGIFRPVYFYGRQLSNQDTTGMAFDRGPSDRYKVLTRAPYYLFQVVNSLASLNLIGNLDRKKLFVRNTKLALGTDIETNEDRMNNFRFRDLSQE